MANVFERGFYTSLGAGLLALETAQGLVKDLIDRGKMAPDEGRKYLDELADRVTSEKDDLRRRFMENVQEQAKNLDLPTNEDFARLTLELEELEKRVALLEAKTATAPPGPIV